MFRFEHPYFLYALLLIPVLVIIFLIIIRIKNNALKKFGELKVILQLMPDISKSRPIIKFIIIIIALAFLIIGLANPQLGTKLEEVKRKGVDLIICLDVSRSMLAEDIKPNRLERAKQAISQLIDNLRNDRIGLIVFAAQSHIQLPITTDYASAKLLLSAVSTDIAPVQGTALGSAINLALETFKQEVKRNEKTQTISNKKNKAIIIISDGENFEDDAVSFATETAKAGIFIHTIGIGSPHGVPIPLYSGNKLIDFKRDKQGHTVITKLNEPLLQQIASIGNGIYIRATTADIGLRKIFNEINKMEKVELGKKVFTDYESRFQYLILPALFLLLIEIFIYERKSKWAEKINLFKKH